MQPGRRKLNIKSKVMRPSRNVLCVTWLSVTLYYFVLDCKIVATKRNILDILLQKRLGFSPQEAFLSLPKWHYWWEMASTISSIITEKMFGQRERGKACSASALSSIMDRVQLLKAQQLHFQPLTDWFSLCWFLWNKKKFKLKSYGCWGPSSVHKECFANSFDCVQWIEARQSLKMQINSVAGVHLFCFKEIVFILKTCSR